MIEADGQTVASGEIAPALSTRVLDWLGTESAERPAPSLLAAFAGIGGVMLGLGLLIAIVGENATRSKFIGVGAALIAVAWAARSFVAVSAIKSMAVGVALVGIPAFSLGATVSNGTDSFWTGALLAVLFLAAWALPGFKNRNLFLALGAIALVASFGSLSARDNNASQIEKCQTYIQQGDFDSFDAKCQNLYASDTTNGVLPLKVTDNIGEQGAIYLIGAALFLSLTWWLDRRGRRGTATAFAAAGLVTAVTGTALLANKFDGSSGGVFVTIVGLIVCIVGSHGARRTTTWAGALMSSLGLVWVVAWEWKPKSSSSTGGVAITVGLLLVAVALAAAAIRSAQPVESAESPSAESPGQ